VYFDRACEAFARGDRREHQVMVLAHKATDAARRAAIDPTFAPLVGSKLRIILPRDNA
jgi:hypothetical protein